MTRGCERFIASLGRRLARRAPYQGCRDLNPAAGSPLNPASVTALSSYSSTWYRQICQPRGILPPGRLERASKLQNLGLVASLSNISDYSNDCRRPPQHSWPRQSLAASPVATCQCPSHRAKVPHTFLPPPPVPASAGLAFVPRFTALRGEWPAALPPPATPLSAHAAGRKGKDGGRSRRRRRGEDDAAAAAIAGESDESLIADEEAYKEDGESGENTAESEADAAVKADSGHGTRMLVVQPRTHPRWLLRAKLSEALRLVDSLTGTDSQWEMEQRTWGGGDEEQHVWRGGEERERPGQEGQQQQQQEQEQQLQAEEEGEEREWQEGREQARQWDEAEGRGRRARSGDGVEGFGFPPPGGGHPWVVVHSRGRGVRAGSFFGSGTIESIAAHVHASHTMGVPVEAVFVNASLSGVQQRNLEAAWGLPVVDRVGLIIEIFGARARTREAKLQVEMAGLEFQRSRLVRLRGSTGRRLGFGSGGEQQVVSARGRAAGGRGFLAGAGESELQLQRRRIAEKQHKLRQQIEQVRRTRGLHRLARRRASWEGGGKGRGLPVVAVVGYTNAGKSTLVTALSQSPQYIDDRLFATLDPRAQGAIERHGGVHIRSPASTSRGISRHAGGSDRS
ncbi:hypothetical protein CLOM_g3674 [Closterium sp. NIES-68]|nr:hypothetical protein CLOM_g3674 [Closterium sp. NIES-68]GJP71520.1 hypothetical protein CLOP_g2347 [Closterium sp. NIES-67]GJP72021.1 hypothetical protein CLOP_g2794 [Closterium sp. NIES-67]